MYRNTNINQHPHPTHHDTRKATSQSWYSSQPSKAITSPAEWLCECAAADSLVLRDPTE
jgi:hypothetical protein